MRERRQKSREKREKTQTINIITLHDNKQTIAIAIAIAIILIVARYCGDQQNHIRPIFNERISYHMAPTQFDIRFITFDNSLIARVNAFHNYISLKRTCAAMNDGQ